MKQRHTYGPVLALLSGLLIITTQPYHAQAQDTRTDTIFHLSLDQALQLARQKNKWVSIAQTEESAVKADGKDVQNTALPQIGAGGNVQRFTKVTLFEEGLSGGHVVDRRPEQYNANLGLDAAVTLFAGGRQKAAANEQVIRKSLASLNTLDQTGIISLQVVAAYLDIVRLTEQDSLISEQIKRAETRLRNIQVLYQNQKVTRSDLLRAQLLLSNQKLSQEQNENDIAIAVTRMDVLLDLPQQTMLVPTDSVSGDKKSMASLAGLVGDAQSGSYAILKVRESLRLQENRIKSIQANNYPTLQLYSAYGLNYPNYLGFPPVDQFYLLGFVGLKMQYNISALYQNKYKQTAARIRLSELKTQEAAIQDNVTQEVNALYIKYGESLSRIRVAEESIAQATANYKIVSAKYFNQLALLTDLLDADNLYLESRYNLIKSQTDALAFCYRILYASGKL